MHRRAFLTTSGMAAVSLGLSGWATNAKPNRTVGRPPVRLSAVNASWDRIIRTTVGLRPHRDPGFVLRPDKLDDKLLVHNYGHGGAGMSIAWGTGLMAAELASEHPSRQASATGRGPARPAFARPLPS